MTKIIWIGILLVAVLSACGQSDQAPPALTQQEQLLVDVFSPQPGEKVLVITDVPKAGIPDNGHWKDRREMAMEWLVSFENLAGWLDIDVHPMMTYEATGSHNGPLPEMGLIDGEEIAFEEILGDTNIVVAMTEYSATAPLSKFTEEFPELRVASMPMVSRSMEQTALAADYAEVARKAAILQTLLDRAVGAEVIFSTDHEMYFDLRFRSARADDGQLHADKEGERIINLPSGEAYIAPYEGERVRFYPDYSLLGNTWIRVGNPVRFDPRSLHRLHLLASFSYRLLYFPSSCQGEIFGEAYSAGALFLPEKHLLKHLQK